MSKVITVFDATSLVGSSISRTLAEKYKVRGLTKDPNSPKAQALKNEGVQIVSADLDDPQSIADAVDGAHAVFVQTSSNFDCAKGHQKEVEQGKRVADICVKANVSHVIYSTQLSVVRVNGMSVRHMDAKAEIEQYMKDGGLPLTGIIVPCSYESLLLTPLRPKKAEHNFYLFEIPMGNTSLNLMCTEDLGPVIEQVVSSPKSYINRTLSVCGDKLTVRDIAAAFSRNLQPLQFKDNQVTIQQFRERKFPGAVDMANMFDFFSRVDQRASVDMTKRLNPDLQSLDQWLCAHRDIAHQALSCN